MDAVLGWHDQRPDDPVGCLGQAADRSGHAVPGLVGGLLRHVDLRRSDDVDQGGQLAVALHRLDRRPRPLRRSRLGGLRLVRRALLPGSQAVGPQGAVLPQAGGRALLGRHRGHRALHHRDVDLGHHAGPDVARLRQPGLPAVLVHRDRRGHASLLRDPCDGRPALRPRRARDGLQLLQDHQGRRRRRSHAALDRRRPLRGGVNNVCLQASR
ncbi:hypothetical protein MTBUT4_100127 [Magnetospirillum sp. UT-4]|nr:hypothetical protein MTBUT4_100127 [Magnetospirillum sp. UT-4]